MSKDITLVIMAAGIGSRFGGGIKQLEPVGPNGEIIMDYSIHDALEAGFNKVVFIIRKDLEKDFKEIIGNRIEKLCKIDYAFQELDNLPDGFIKPDGRTKPWGTGQAVLACKGIVNEPFVIINADDYYGKEAFVKVHDFLIDAEPRKYCGAGFILKNTLSDNGGVTRGICKLDAEMNLIDIAETPDIIKTADGASAGGQVIDAESYVSMNMWGVTPEYIDLLETGFQDFLANVEKDNLKAEFLVPVYMDKLIKNGEITVKMLETNDKWFGVTYKEDKESVANAFKDLYAKGVYKNNLYE
ncbi:MAG: nucleotidyltransferase [Clostridia bacterium]|nr:nucleotidyltransferase [Clostridia bacterium]